MFMDNYPDKAPVISAGLDALIFFARNGLIMAFKNCFCNYLMFQPTPKIV